MYDPRARHLSQMFFFFVLFFFFNLESILEREENRSTRRKTRKSGRDRLKLDPRTIAEVGGANVEHNANLTSPGIH